MLAHSYIPALGLQYKSTGTPLATQPARPPSGDGDEGGDEEGDEGEERKGEVGSGGITHTSILRFGSLPGLGLKKKHLHWKRLTTSARIRSKQAHEPWTGFRALRHPFTKPSGNAAPSPFPCLSRSLGANSRRRPKCTKSASASSGKLGGVGGVGAEEGCWRAPLVRFAWRLRKACALGASASAFAPWESTASKSASTLVRQPYSSAASLAASSDTCNGDRHAPLASPAAAPAWWVLVVAERTPLPLPPPPPPPPSTSPPLLLLWSFSSGERPTSSRARWSTVSTSAFTQSASAWRCLNTLWSGHALGTKKGEAEPSERTPPSCCGARRSAAHVASSTTLWSTFCASRLL
mmetsp:Transcript_46378/g.86448  ORF Transcript_46378/g.86448 Transcript_46378/m.86448 type:complete len:350 (+) Transcript_46378:1094-2143(+)